MEERLKGEEMWGKHRLWASCSEFSTHSNIISPASSFSLSYLLVTTFHSYLPIKVVFSAS